MARLWWLASLVMCISVSQGCSDGMAEGDKMNEAMAELATTPRLFVEDGACDFHVSLDRPSSAARLLARDGVYLLIDNLDNIAPSAAVFRGRRGEVATPVGYLCLDVLLQISADGSPALREINIGDDGIWTRAEPAFCYRPDVLVEDDGPEIMRRVKANWQAAFDSGDLQLTTARKSDKYSQRD